MTDLRECPHCGLSSAHTRCREFMTEADGSFHVVICGACKARGPQRQGYDEAEQAWNMRLVSSPAQRAYGGSHIGGVDEAFNNIFGSSKR